MKIEDAKYIVLGEQMFCYEVVEVNYSEAKAKLKIFKNPDEWMRGNWASILSVTDWKENN